MSDFCDSMDCMAHQASLSVGFSRQEYWSGLPCPPSENLPDSKINPTYWQAGSLPLRSDQSLSRVRLFATPWTVACQASLSMRFSRQQYWSGLPFPLPEDLPDPRIEPHVCCLGRQILYHWAAWEAPIVGLLLTIFPLFPFLSGLYNQIWPSTCLYS